MPPFRQPTFQERAALATKAKGGAMERLRAKPPIDEAVVSQRQEAERRREATQLKAREDRRAAEKARKDERLAEIAASAPPPEPVRTEAELKAIRDAKFAARKLRKNGK